MASSQLNSARHIQIFDYCWIRALPILEFDGRLHTKWNCFYHETENLFTHVYAYILCIVKTKNGYLNLMKLCYTHCNMVCNAYMKMHVYVIKSCIFANNKCQVFAFLILYFCTWIIFRDTFVKFTNDVQN
ncbi:hypothetical protein V1478_012044 [Vespula squamosa]|uniref:Uncharacterized protein n=1 Tax=Vespula squamosa TaxID=30214 RepID=A0ABD2AC27_VESSQ